MSLARDIADLGSVTSRLDTLGASNRNIIINGGQIVDQRNSGSAITLTSSHQYATDRFICRLGTSSSSTAQRVADAPDGLYNSVKITIGTGATPSAATATGYFAYKTEGLDTSHLKFGSSDAQTITLSFYVKSSLTGSFGVTVANDALDRSFPSSYTINSANTWERKSITVTGDTSGTWATTNAAAFYLLWDLGCGSDVKGTANTWAGSDFRGGATGTINVCATSSATWQITGVQMEIGSEVTDFEHEPYSVTLSKAKRYFEVYAPVTNDDGSLNVWRTRTSVNNYNGVVHFLEKRAQPTCTLDYDRLHKPGVAKDTLSNISITIGSGQTQSCTVNCTPDNDSTISTSAFLGKNSGTGKVTLDAEL